MFIISRNTFAPEKETTKRWFQTGNFKYKNAINAKPSLKTENKIGIIGKSDQNENPNSKRTYLRF